MTTEPTRFPYPSGTCGIAWTDITLNPGLYGCSKVSPACKHCYAEMMAARLAKMGQAHYEGATKDGHWTGRVTVRPIEEAVAKVLAVPRARGGALRYVFVTSMSDVLHEDVPVEWTAAIVRAMGSRPDVTWQLLTKRARRYPELVAALGIAWPWNVWAGATVESDDYADRLGGLAEVPGVRWVSAEPLVGRIPVPDWLSWVVVGGESGDGWRPMDYGHVRDVQAQCADKGIAFFFKQAAGFSPRKDLGDAPEDVRVREMPWMAA